MSTLQDFWADCYKKTMAIIGKRVISDKTHSFSALSTLTMGATSLTLLKRDRTYHYALSLDFKRQDAYVGEGGTNPGGIEAGSDSFTESKSTSIDDNWTAEDVEIIYLDPRNDLVVYRKTVVTVAYAMEGLVNTIPHYSNFANLPITIAKTVETHSSIDGLLETISSIDNVTMNLTTCSADLFHLLSQFVPEPWYSDNQGALDIMDLEDNERDGWLLSYPTWVIYLFANKAFDQSERAVNGNEITSPQTFTPVIAADDTPQGSWAFDPAGNRFVSQLLSDGSVFNFLTDGDAVTVTAIEGSNPKFYPVSII